MSITFIDFLFGFAVFTLCAVPLATAFAIIWRTVRKP